MFDSRSGAVSVEVESGHVFGREPLSEWRTVGAVWSRGSGAISKIRFDGLLLHLIVQFNKDSEELFVIVTILAKPGSAQSTRSHSMMSTVSRDSGSPIGSSGRISPDV